MAPESPPTLADQVSRLYDLIAGYHATHLLEIARELGVWAALVRAPGLGSEGRRWVERHHDQRRHLAELRAVLGV